MVGSRVELDNEGEGRNYLIILTSVLGVNTKCGPWTALSDTFQYSIHKAQPRAPNTDGLDIS